MISSKSKIEQKNFLYNQIADKLERNIIDGVLKNGDKLPSVRALSKEQGVSHATAFKAYAQLEVKGLIQARPKSGFYIDCPVFPLSSVNPAGQVQISKPTSVDDIIALVYKNLHTKSLVRLSIAVPAPELLPAAKLSKTMAETIRTNPSQCVSYEDSQGNLMLRQQIARYAFNWRGQISAEQVVTTQGCMEALVFALMSVAGPGDIVAIETPTYFGIFGVIHSLGLKVVEIPTDPRTGIDIDHLAEAIQTVSVKACLFVTNFTNPLGCSMPDDHKKRLVKLLAKNQIPLIEDDVYGELYFGKSRPRTCKSYDEQGLVLLCSSVSKSLAPGYRVGWCIPGRFKDKFLKVKLLHSVSSASPTQAAIGLFMQTGRYDLHLRKLRATLYLQSQLYRKAIQSHFPAPTRISEPQGGYVLWIELDKSIDALELFRIGLKQDISISPGQMFSTDGRFSNYIRISFGIPFSQRIEHAIKVLGTLATTLMRAKLS